MEAKDTQLQQKDTQLQQQGAKLQQQDTELQEKAAEINRQQRELQTLSVRKWRYTTVLYRAYYFAHALVVRRREEGCRQRWRLRMLK